MADGFDVVAVGIAHEGSVVTGVVLGPDPGLVQHFGAGLHRRVEKRSHRRSIGGLERDVRLAKAATRVRAQPEIGLQVGAVADVLTKVHHAPETEGHEHGVVEGRGSRDIGALNPKMVEHAVHSDPRQGHPRKTAEVDRFQPSLGNAYFNQLSYRFLEGDADATVEIDITDDLRGPTGAVHAGITLLLADVAGSMAIAVRTERVGATSSVSVHCLAAAKVGPLRATATMLRASKNSALADVRVVDAGNNDRLVAVAHVTGGLFGHEAGAAS